MKWLFIIWSFAVLSWSVAVRADDFCQTTKIAQVELTMHVSNFMNLKTTRTPEGGPYKPWVCKQGDCRKSTKAPILKYERDHPDADENGMVAYPNTSLEEEMDAIMAEYAELSILGRLHACGAEYVESGNQKFVFYKNAKTLFGWVLFILGNDGRVKYVYHREP